MDLYSEVRWSDGTYNLEDIRTAHSECPLLLKVARGVHGTTQECTIPADQMVLLHKWEVSERVVAVNREGIWLTIPIDHKHKLEVINKENSFEKLGPYIIQDVIKRFKPPVKARFDPKKRAEFYIQNKLHNSRDFGFFQLTSVHYMDYAKGSVISADGKINRHRISILPMNVGAEFYVGISMYSYSDDYFLNLLHEVSRSSGPLVNDNTNVYGFSGITECDDTMTLSKATAKTVVNSSKTWGRREGSKLYSSTSEPPEDDPTPKPRHTLPKTAEPLHPKKDEVGDQAMAIYANYDVATTPNKRHSDHTDTERRGSKNSLEPIPIYENVEGLRRAQKEADGIQYGQKDEGVSNDQGSDLDKADYENVDTAGGHDSSSSEGDYYNHPGGPPTTFAPRPPSDIHKWQEDDKNHGDSPDDIYQNQATASLILNRQPSGIEKHRIDDQQDHQLDAPDATYQNQLTASSLQKALSDRTRQQRDKGDHSDVKESDYHESPDAIYQNQGTLSSKKGTSSASITKKPAPPPRIRNDPSGRVGWQGDSAYYNSLVGGMDEDSPDSLYQNQNQISASSPDVSRLPPPAPSSQGENQYINAPGVDSRDGSLRSRKSAGILPRYRPSDLLKGSLTSRRRSGDRDSDEQSTISSRSSDYSRFWHTDDAVDENLESQGVTPAARFEVLNLPYKASLSASSDNSDYDDASAEETSRRSKRAHSTMVKKGPLRSSTQNGKSEGTENNENGETFSEASSTTSSVGNASIRSKSTDVSYDPEPESARVRDDSQPILPPKDYTSLGKDRKRGDSQPILPSKDYTSTGKDKKRDDSQPILPSKDYTSTGKDKKRDDSQPILPSKDYISTGKDKKRDDSQPILPSKDYTTKGKNSMSLAGKPDVSSSPVQPGTKASESAPLPPPQDPTTSMSASIGKKSPSINSMPREQAPVKPKSAASYKTQTYHNLQQVPEDISNLGVSEVSDCLSLLNLAEFIDPFSAAGVDGRLLKNCTRENLAEEFGMGSVSANKVVLLINGTVQSLNIRH